jgi:hypothetical protein
LEGDGSAALASSVIIGTPHVERVTAFEPEHDPILTALTVVLDWLAATRR